MSFQGGFESVQRWDITDFSRERVPESGGCNTEGLFLKGMEARVRDGEETRVG